MTHVYLDNAATTPVAPAVVTAMMDQMTGAFGNPSSTHYFGRMAHTQLDQARQTLAAVLHAKPRDLVFTSGATESNNTAIMMTAQARQKEGKHIITTAIEHPSVLKPMAALEAQGFKVTYLPVDENGEISLADFDAALDDETILVSIMAGNNEVGSRMPLAEIGARLQNHPAYFHVDGTQAFGTHDMDVNALHIDFLSASAHKLNGPKGVGLLYRSPATRIAPFIRGGEQETKRRAGTENMPGIVGFAAAASELDDAAKAELTTRYQAFTETILQTLKAAGVTFEVNGNLDRPRLDHVLNLYLPGVSTYALQTNLDLAGFAISGGSACTAGSLEPSHVLTAMYGEKSPRLAESIRISYGRMNTMAEVQQFADKLVTVCQRLLQRKH